MKDVDYDVLVVGLGPVGATLAGLLRGEGLSVIAIDRESDVYPLPRAGAFDAESMRIFQSFGVAEQLLPICRVMDGYEFLSTTGETLMRFDIPPVLGPLGWSATYVLHQPSIERTLRQRLAELGVDMRLNTKLIGFTQDDDGVAAQVETVEGAATITARYIVGCDGANSRVRETIGGTSFDYGFSESWLVIDAIVDDDDGLPEIATQILDPAQPTTFMHMTGDRYRWEFMLKPGDDPDVFSSDENIAKLMSRWNENDRLRIERRALYRFRGLVAETWRDGRALLAGDAAHLMPPFAGQGMCSGFRDAANLAWKLGAIVRGGDDHLLESYQAEREPHVRGIIERSIEFGRMICILDPAAAAQRDAGMLAMRAAGRSPPMLPDPPLQGGCLMETVGAGTLFLQPVIDGKRLDDQLGSGAWLIARAEMPDVPTGLAAFSIAAGALGIFAAPLSEWLDQQAAAGVLVRPDRRIFGVGDPAELIVAWRDATMQKSISDVLEPVG